jgi:hypothetical protein
MLGIPSAETELLRKMTPASHDVALSGGLALPPEQRRYWRFVNGRWAGVLIRGPSAELKPVPVEFYRQVIQTAQRQQCDNSGSGKDA